MAIKTRRDGQKREQNKGGMQVSFPCFPLIFSVNVPIADKQQRGLRVDSHVSPSLPTAHSALARTERVASRRVIISAPAKVVTFSRLALGKQAG